MTNQAMNDRSDRADNLKVFQVGLGNYFVESSMGKICYKVGVNNGTKVCTCADYARNVQHDHQFMCKHIIAAMSSNGNSEPASLVKNGRPKLDERFITVIKKKNKEKEFVVYAGLLDLAHQKGLRSVNVETLQLPRKENGMEAICMATVVSFSGETYTEVGDANPKNVTDYVASHILRVAATRAKARAFRDMTNIGMTCLEELGNLDDMEQEGGSAKGKAEKKAAPRKEPPAQKAAPEPQSEQKPAAEQKPEPQKTAAAKGGNGNNGDGAKLSTAQRNAIASLAKRRKISDEDLEKMSVDTFGLSIEYLTPQDAAVFIRNLQQAA